MITVLIIDDERGARSLIREYLSGFPEMSVLGEACDGAEAEQMIHALKPDLIFLDIQMPVYNGFELVKRLTFFPKIIFTTAFDEFALRAFEANAIDYLLKPYTRERFSKAVSKVLNRTDSSKPLQDLLENLIIKTDTPVNYMLLEKGKVLVNVAVDQIMYLEAEKEYTRIVTADSSYLSNLGITLLEKKLDPTRFIRIHRSHIVHIAFIKEVRKEPNNYQVILTNGSLLNIGRSYLDQFKKLIL
ncbi:MAG: response regulator transcription factor [Sediminibacterium sp.]|nr:response regulator transcription factor [Sediminibacterium sp.]